MERTVWVWGRAVDRQPQDLQFRESKTQETDGEPYVIFRLQANQAGQNCSPVLHRQTTWSWMQPGNGGASSPWESNSQMVKVGSGTEQSMPHPHLLSPDQRNSSCQGEGFQWRSSHRPQAKQWRVCLKTFEMCSYCHIMANVFLQDYGVLFTVPGLKAWDPFGGFDVVTIMTIAGATQFSYCRICP